MDELWFEEDLKKSKDDEISDTKGVNNCEKLDGIPKIRVYKPHWQSLGKPAMQSDIPAILWAVRLTFELDPGSSRKNFEYALCEAYLVPTIDTNLAPTVYDLYPLSIYEGSPQTVTLEFSPGIKVVNAVELSLGKIGTDFQVGRVAPVTQAFRGEKARNPQWRMEAKQHQLIGLRDFYILVENPEEYKSFSLLVRVEGIIAGCRLTSRWPKITIQ